MEINKKISIAEILTKPFTLDGRALSLFRIGISLVLLWDNFIFLPDVKAFYSNEGILPIPELMNYLWNDCFWSLNNINGSAIFQYILWVVYTGALSCLLIGYRAKIATWVVWILLVSFQNRNLMVLQGGDDLARLLIFWGLFLPWDRYYTLFSSKPPIKNHFSFATVGLVLLIGGIYFYSALLKTSEEWRTEYTAIYYAFSLDQIVLPLGKMLLPYGEILKVITHRVWLIEFWAPLLLLIPFYTYFFRYLFIFLIGGILLGIGMTLYVGLFFVVGLAGLLPLFPSGLMDKIDSLLNIKRQEEKMNSYKLPLAVNILALVIVATMLVWNTARHWKVLVPVIDPLVPAIYTARLDQNWAMFAPGVFKDDGWYVYEGITTNGDTIDIMNNQVKVDYKKPDLVVSVYSSYRWRKFSENMLFSEKSHFRTLYCRYLLKEWNHKNPQQQVSMVRMIYFKEVNLKNHRTAPVKKEVLCTYSLR